jgi:uncharacterized glyoxalase superfamily protein PhnB
MFDLYIHVEDVERLYEELVSRGADIVHGPVDQGYGTHEFGVRDPHGYILAFGRVRDEPTKPDGGLDNLPARARGRQSSL